MKILLLCALIAMPMLFFLSCKKGDTGLTGPAGPPGSDGQPGPKGDSGVTSVIYSAWLDVTFTPDTAHFDDVIDTLGYFATISSQTLTSAIMSSGEVRVYMNIGSTTDPHMFVLPYLNVYTGLNVVPEFSINTIRLYANADLGTRTVNGEKVLQYRYIIVPGTMLGLKFDPLALLEHRSSSIAVRPSD